MLYIHCTYYTCVYYVKYKVFANVLCKCMYEGNVEMNVGVQTPPSTVALGAAPSWNPAAIFSGELSSSCIHPCPCHQAQDQVAEKRRIWGDAARGLTCLCQCLAFYTTLDSASLK